MTTLTDAVCAVRPRMDAIVEVDAVTADLLQIVVAALEEQRWILRDGRVDDGWLAEDDARGRSSVSDEVMLTAG